MILLAGALHLASPNRAAHRHAAPVGPVDYAFNADSAAFARIVVRFPAGLWETEAGRARILRPLYPALAWPTYAALRPAASLIPERWLVGAERLKGRATHPEWWTGIPARDLAAAWGALVAVNLGILWAGGLLTFAALRRLWGPSQAFWMTALLLLHFDVVDFVLVPHTECFNLLVPAFVLWWTVSGAPRPVAAAWALGGLMLGKGIAFPLANVLREGLKRPGSRARAAAVLLLGFALPVSLYAAFLHGAGLPSENHEMARYRQFVWMLDAARQGDWLSIPARWAAGAWIEVVHVARGFWIPLSGMAWLAVRRRRPISGPLPDGLAGQMALYAGACLLFWTLSGYHAERLSLLYFPPLWILLGTALARGTGRPARWGAGLLVAQAAGIYSGLFRY